MLAQETLRESEERFRLIADSAPVPIWVTKLDRTRSFANRAYVDFLGLPYEQAIVFDWRKVLHPDDLPHILQEQIAGEASLKPFVLEARYLNSKGEWRWLRSSRNHAGSDRQAYRIHRRRPRHHRRQAGRDRVAPVQRNTRVRISERTAQLKTSEAQMRAIFETTTNIRGCSTHGDCSTPTERRSQASGRSSEVIGKPFWDTPWFSGTEGIRDIVHDAFIAVCAGKRSRPR